MARYALRIIGVLGALVFGAIFYLTYGVPGYVEEIGKAFIRDQILDETNARIEGLGSERKDGKLVAFAQTLYRQNQAQIEAVQQQLRSKAHERLADVVTQMRDLDCACRAKYAQMYKEGFEFRLASLQSVNEKLLDFMRTKYMQVATELTRDIRIFTGSNTLVFVLLLLLSFLKPKAVSQLFVPGVLLSTATLLCSYFYIFEQNWLLAMIYNDYLGFVYLAYVFVVFLFLCDIALNRARVSTEIINAALEALGSAASVSPC